jgi:diguanylate cyclase (GGDEF)-like protein/hemerythrin-like metal-binding protein/PAS domain S-box-containing protein
MILKHKKSLFLARFVGLVVVYAWLAKIVLLISINSGNITILWLPGGIALAAMLLWGMYLSPAIFIGAMIAGILVGDSLSLSCWIALGNTLESVGTAWLLKKLNDFDVKLVQIKHFVQLSIAACLGCLISAIIGPLALLSNGFISSKNFLFDALYWWQADVLGILVATPFLLVWLDKNKSAKQSYLFLLHLTVFVILCVLVNQVLFLGFLANIFSPYAEEFYVFLFVTWGAVYFGRKGVTFVIMVSAIQSLAGLINHGGVFSSDFQLTQLENFWFFILVLASVGTSLAINIEQRNNQQEYTDRLNKIYSVLVKTNRAALTSLSESDLYNAICQIVESEFGGVLVWIGCLQAGKENVEVRAYGGLHAESVQTLKISMNPTLAEGRNQASIALREGRAVVVADFNNDVSTQSWINWSLRTGNWQSSAAFPIFKGQEPCSVLAIFSKNRQTFDEQVVALLSDMSADISSTLDKLTARAEKEKAVHNLLLSERRFHTIFETTRDALVIYTPDGKCQHANSAALELFECHQLSDLIGKTALDISPDYQPDGAESAEKMRHAMSFALSCGAYLFEWTHIRKNGAVLQVEVLLTRFAIDDGVFVISSSRDITERKQAENRLKLAAQVFFHAREGVLITDENINIIECNDALMQLTGYDKQELLGKNPRILSSDVHGAEFYKEMWETLLRDGFWSGELWGKRKNGELYVEYLTISQIKDAQGRVLNYVGLYSDITAVKEYQKQLEHIAHYDALTGLPNRVLLADRLRQVMSQVKRHGLLMAVAYIDLDGFKEINDSYGHPVGDELLIIIAQRMKTILRACDTLSRIGGDEFIAVLADLEKYQDYNLVLGRLLSVVSETILIDGHALKVSASIGVTIYPDDAADADQLLRHADQAMYQAKQLGKNQCYFFDPKLDMEQKNRLDLRQKVEQALNNNEFELFYQPQVELEGRRVVGVEALLRWRCPKQGLILPDAFLPVIENSVLELRLGQWVIDRAFHDIEYWLEHNIEFNVSINISANHLQSSGFCNDLDQAFSQYPRVRASALQIEILETAAFSDFVAVSETINKVKALGVSFAIDDFGTGYSSLSYLRRLPVETLKIDLGFVRDMLVDKEDRAIVKGIIALAKSFNRKTVAEGVETIEHLMILQELGCDVGQGYFIAMPMSAAALQDWYAEHSKQAVTDRASDCIQTMPDSVAWDAKHEIGNETIDCEHQLLFKLIVELHEGIKNQLSNNKLNHVIGEIFNYVRYHFISEENFMEEVAYPDFQLHREQHLMLMDNLYNAYEAARTEAAFDYQSFFCFLYRWFLTHVSNEDKKIAEYLKRAGR